MILVDAGPLIALLDDDDQLHEAVSASARQLKDPLLTTWPALAEAFYMLAEVDGAAARLWEIIDALEIHPLGVELHARMKELMDKYADLPMDLADASLVAVAESRRVYKVFTTDRRDFSVYRLKNGRHLTLIG